MNIQIINGTPVAVLVEELDTQPEPLTCLDEAIFNALTAPAAYENDGLQDGCYLDEKGYVVTPQRPNRATRRAEAAQERRANPPKLDRNATALADDLDTPNRRPGHCPECGQLTFAAGNRHECSFCNWSGAAPSYSPRVAPKPNMPHATPLPKLLGCRVAT